MEQQSAKSRAKEQKKLLPADTQEIAWIVRKFNERNKLRRPDPE